MALHFFYVSFIEFEHFFFCKYLPFFADSSHIFVKTLTGKTPYDRYRSIRLDCNFDDENSRHGRYYFLDCVYFLLYIFCRPSNAQSKQWSMSQAYHRINSDWFLLGNNWLKMKLLPVEVFIYYTYLSRLRLFLFFILFCCMLLAVVLS